ncbi:putative endoplasmic reticulum metallopeptidase 1-A [Diplonema papillatum]|nr:putative endoplasmic reticulum metallopeptidase 1-A [Diplonema papillatum]
MALPDTYECRSLCLLHVAVLLLVAYCHEWLPEVKDVGAPDDVFSSGRAMAHLHALLDTGVRTVGSRSNEVMAPLYLLQQLEKIKVGVHADIEFEFEMQWPSGGFSTPFLGTFQNTYGRVSNVLVRISPKGKLDGPALLVGAHFDSALGTVGASDDCLNIAAMVEVLRLMVRQPLGHAVVFNFNGAEETNWQAAHGFITQHRWAPHVKAMVNLESSGTGGREIVIQNGPANAWIGRTYANHVPHPHINGIAQLIFESGVIPAQTDFQTYRDYHPILDKLPGMDLAVVAGGYVYHTPQDDIAHVDPAHVQRLGENVFALVNGLSRSPHLAEPGDLKTERDTTFDVLGLVVFHYSSMTGHLLNVGSLAAAYYIISTSIGMQSAFGGLTRLVLPAFGTAIALPVCVALALTLLHTHASWYSNTWVAFVLYALPSVVGVCAVYVSRGVEEVRAKQNFAATQRLIVTSTSLLFAILLTPLTLIGHTLTTFMLIVWLLPLYVRYACDALRVLQSPLAVSHVFFVSSVPGLLLWWHLYMTVAGFFLPLIGRIGDKVPPNLLIAVVSGVLLGHMLLIPLCSVVAFPKQVLTVGARICGVVFCLAVVAALVILPVYTPERPKRLFMQHTHRTWHDASGQVINEDSGLWVSPMDYEGMRSLQNAWPVLKEARDAPCDPSSIYCNYPWYFPVAGMIGGGKWIPTPAPAVAKINLAVRKEDGPAPGRRTAHVSATGPPQMAFIINQRAPNAAVLNWTFSGVVPAPRTDCDCHFIFHSAGAPASIRSVADLDTHVEPVGDAGLRYKYRPFDTPVTWNFTIEFDSAAPVDVAIYGHYLDSPLAPEFQVHRQTLPKWVTDLAWPSTWSAHKL